MRWNIIVECVGEYGKQSTITLGTIEWLAGSTTAENLGVNLQESKQIANRLQDTVVKQQLQEHCDQRRKCLTCGRLRPIKDFRCRRLILSWGPCASRFRDTDIVSAAAIRRFATRLEVLPGRVPPEFRHLQVSLGSADFLPQGCRSAANASPTGGRNYPYHHPRPVDRGWRAHRRRDATGDRRKSKTR
jgi:hypothetical protein